MLLLDVGEDADGIGPDGLAIPQQRAGGGFDQAFIGDVREDKALHSYEGRAAGMCHSEGAEIGAGQNLNSQRQPRRAPHLGANYRHSGADLRSH